MVLNLYQSASLFAESVKSSLLCQRLIHVTVFRYAGRRAEWAGIGGYTKAVFLALTSDRDLASALATYDWILTLEDERRFVWGRKLSLASCIFLANRMTTITPLLDVSLQSGISVCGVSLLLLLA